MEHLGLFAYIRSTDCCSQLECQPKNMGKPLKSSILMMGFPYIYIYTSIFQRVLFEPQGMVYRHPLSSIQHPLEDPGLCVKTFFLYFYRVWVTPCSTGLRPGDVFHYFQHPFFGPTYFWFNILLNFSKTFGPKAPHT